MHFHRIAASYLCLKKTIGFLEAGNLPLGKVIEAILEINVHDQYTH